MQRKNKASNASKTTVTEQISPLIEESNSKSSPSQVGQESTTTNTNAVKLDLSENDVVAVATVVRRSCGTSAFDRHWLNVDCCGLFCASLTYMLLLYGAHAVCNILIPPWLSYTTDDGIRHVSFYLSSITPCSKYFFKSNSIYLFLCECLFYRFRYWDI